MGDNELFWLLQEQKQAAAAAREARRKAAAQPAPLSVTATEPSDVDQPPIDAQPEGGGASAPPPPPLACRSDWPTHPAHSQRYHLSSAAASLLHALADGAEYTQPFSAAACCEALLAVLLPQSSHGADGSTIPAAVAAATAAHSTAQLTGRLLELGADPNYVRPDDGVSPLLAAVRGGHTEAACMLLEAGAAPDGPAPPPAELAGAADAGPAAAAPPAKRRRQGGDPAVASPALQPTPLVQAAAAGSAALVERLLAAGAQPNLLCSVQGSRGMPVQLTPLIAAVNAGDAALVARLLEAGADVHLKCAIANGADWTRWA